MSSQPPFLKFAIDTVQLCQSKTPPQLLDYQCVTTAVLIKAEGTGFEPATPYGAPHFECGC